ncbi:hypothetical protein K3G39_04615 [Pontibacter sp. HSC-14F20]|uniref:hypothetical protein n=1 Tax=Pontibacter sp. HSC-14F20 TaxID=2864136 RepID=UPI001C734F36|nr:hypothetical protein [Pontibacter sp. HSC-14F20]MBX0332515.1 hypothetical protein [Pontibacter sp. HSC-14F20]
MHTKVPSLILTSALFLINTDICQPAGVGTKGGENQKESILLSRYGAFIEESEFLAPGGIITVTDSKLIFTPVKTFLRKQVSITEIPRSEIAAVRRTNTFGIVPNGIVLQLQNGSSQKLKTIILRRKKLYHLLLDQIER